ncbi:MAG TPA: class I SAM-dependent methyltransferase [Armatimonadota bacterium]|nr:class I SAM-dependent methyltransferase [Armatimonadota bacterium]
MNHVWWRTHLRKLPELGFLDQFGDFNEVDDLMPFLTEALELPHGARVLDLGCGRGSFGVRLAQWGYQVTAIDDSAPMLEIARETAAQRGVEIALRQADLRSLPERSVFDGALILDFGTFSDPDNAAMMRAVAAALKPGGRVVFGTCNPYYWSREPRTEHRSMEGTDVIRRYQFDFPTGTLASRIRFIRPDGERKDLPEARYRAYTLPELRGLTGATALADLHIHGQDESGIPRPDRPLDSLRTPYFACVAIRPITGESGEGI